MSYSARIVDRELGERLTGTGAVVIEGARACGKTATARNISASEALLDIDDNMREAVTVNPSLVLEGEAPRLIDEWQIAPAIWNHVRRAVDDRGKPRQFILTGSVTPADDATRHSGAGRITRLRMRPMSLFELGRSNGKVSLSRLLDGEPIAEAKSELTISEIAKEAAVGGWPGLRDIEPEPALRALRGYVDEIRRVDVSRVDEKRRDPNRVGRTPGEPCSKRGHPCRGDDARQGCRWLRWRPRRRHGPEYLDALERLMVVENQPAWAPHLRSTHTLRRAPKRHFVDPSLRSPH